LTEAALLKVLLPIGRKTSDIAIGDCRLDFLEGQMRVLLSAVLGRSFRNRFSERVDISPRQPSECGLDVPIPPLTGRLSGPANLRLV
jgi:hypothetical protein